MPSAEPARPGPSRYEHGDIVRRIAGIPTDLTSANPTPISEGAPEELDRLLIDLAVQPGKVTEGLQSVRTRLRFGRSEGALDAR
jgi:hypothetical protein